MVVVVIIKPFSHIEDAIAIAIAVVAAIAIAVAIAAINDSGNTFTTTDLLLYR